MSFMVGVEPTTLGGKKKRGKLARHVHLFSFLAAAIADGGGWQVIADAILRRVAALPHRPTLLCGMPHLL